ncbi:PP2C family protein-serine/threonine phosphatase [Neomicrococcus aestuarii]|uniref:PP2C family protein-serine/threonine phosphatase n=1 Tax=Neomicrococcus aestuarii TaxID=556325 RepID=UPI000A01CA56|nr:PP2C family serine/threonine-protein phosphatase [Neomicrococcus aestuarii]
MPLALRFAAASHVGRVRSKNDDSGYAGTYFAVVADGMGGHVGGDVASASTVLDLVHLDRPHHEDAETILPDEIQTANTILNELVNHNPKLQGMGTTVTALLLTDETFQFSHIGDSRAYRLKDGVFEQISKDHTFVQRLVDEGRIRPEEAETHPHKNVLMRVLGDSDASPELDIEQIPVAPGERWLLCSDGLNACVSEAVVERIVRGTKDLQEATDDLVQVTLANGAPDNVTVVLFDVVEESEDDQALNTLLDNARAAGDDHAPDTGQILIAASGSDVEASAALIRHQMATRPHKLVGAAQLATESGLIPIVTQRSGERRAAELLTHKSEQARQEQLAAIESAEATQLAKSRPRSEKVHGRLVGVGPSNILGDGTIASTRRWGLPRWLVPAFLAFMTVVMVVITWFAYSWTQTQYYVGNYSGKVAIFKGVSQELGPLKLSRLDTPTDIPLDVLPAYTQQRITNALPARDLEHAQEIVGELLITARQSCPVLAPATGSTSENETATTTVPSYCTDSGSIESPTLESATPTPGSSSSPASGSTNSSGSSGATGSSSSAAASPTSSSNSTSTSSPAAPSPTGGNS